MSTQGNLKKQMKRPFFPSITALAFSQFDSKHDDSLPGPVLNYETCDILQVYFIAPPCVCAGYGRSRGEAFTVTSHIVTFFCSQGLPLCKQCERFRGEVCLNAQKQQQWV